LYDPSAGLVAAATSALLAAFGPQQRGFGQGVAASEVTTVLQSVPGVLAVDLLQLHRVDPADDGAAVESYLPAAAAAWDRQRGEVVPAELLVIDPATLALSVAPASAPVSGGAA
jgi:hypothetical protein